MRKYPQRNTHDDAPRRVQPRTRETFEADVLRRYKILRALRTFDNKVFDGGPGRFVRKACDMEKSLANVKTLSKQFATIPAELR